VRPGYGNAEQDQCNGDEQGTRRHRSRVRTELLHRKVSEGDMAQPGPQVRSIDADE
jgi:hypothetical protein